MPAAATDARRAGVLVVLGAAYALVAASTTPFSRQANLATALPIVVLAVAAVIRWPLRPQRSAGARARSPARVGADGGGAGHPFAGWVVLGLLIVGWEFAQYLLPGSRALHPTLSSMTDAVDRYYVLKAVVFFLWLWLGAAIVRAGTALDPAGEGLIAPSEVP